MNMENQPLAPKPKFEKLGRFYLIALFALAVSFIISQLLIQSFISEQENDSHLINLSGRQRMLSQNISKTVLLLGNATDTLKRKELLRDLAPLLMEWDTAYAILQSGGGKESFHVPASRVSADMFAGIDSEHNLISQAGQAVYSALENDMAVAPDSLIPYIDKIVANEKAFLNGMDQIVSQYEKEARTKVFALKRMEIFLLVVLLAIIAFEVFFIFLPSVRTIRETFEKRSLSEEKSRKMALEMSALYNSLEQAYQDLLEVDVSVEDFTVYARCNPEGDFDFFSERFGMVMEFEEEKPVNLFDWLEAEGYGADYLKSIRQLVLSGQSWNGEIKVTSRSGDFVWLRLNIVPTMNEDGSVATLMIIGADETEKKEAEAISQEISRERIEKKVKEQQFRSVLILEGQEEERKRISRDMHDGIGQLLSAMKFNLESIHSVGSPNEKENLKTSRDLLLKVIREVRLVPCNLTPSALSDYGIVSVLNKFSKEMSKIADIQVTFENKTGFLSRLEGKVENNLYRIVQEAVNNTIKYAEANEIKITISHNFRYLQLDITDNGKGFDISKLEAEGHFSASGHGIFNIRERANFVNGQCEITSVKGVGTTIQITVPLD